MQQPSIPLTAKQQADLLAIARLAIRARVRGFATVDPSSSDPRLCAPGAAFVTLTRAGQLRGCIGYVHPILPLAETVAECAAAAATGDPRFPAVTTRELPHLALEISVLSPLRPLPNPAEVEVGVHGLHISDGHRRGLLLPQVATEQGWDRETFLRQTCLKAGLSPDAWRRGAQIQVFTVQHFTDHLPVETEPGEADSCAREGGN
jgi:AmmeMemoRadiSam system protein A